MAAFAKSMLLVVCSLLRNHPEFRSLCKSLSMIVAVVFELTTGPNCCSKSETLKMFEDLALPRERHVDKPSAAGV